MEQTTRRGSVRAPPTACRPSRYNRAVPSPPDRAGTFLGRLLALARGRREADAARPGPPPRWPHLVRGWLDPDMPLAATKTSVDRADVEDVLRTVARLSEGRVGDAEVAEVLDALAQADDGSARAFRFGRPRTFGQLWIGAAPSRAPGVTLFVLGAHAFVEALEEALSVARFEPAAKREEYDRLRRFFLAAWEWQWTAAPFASELRASTPGDLDPARAAESLERVLSNPRSPLLEVLRGLRRRTRDLLEETADLAAPDLAAADAYLSARGAATLSEMRRRYLPAPAPA